jgi:hypothetical protein
MLVVSGITFIPFHSISLVCVNKEKTRATIFLNVSEAHTDRVDVTGSNQTMNLFNWLRNLGHGTCFVEHDESE